MDQANNQQYRHFKAAEFIELIMQMMGCQCERCRTVPSRDRYTAISQALIDATAEHIFSGCAADVAMGEKSMLDALTEAKKIVVKCFEEFEIPQSVQAKGV